MTQQIQTPAQAREFIQANEALLNDLWHFIGARGYEFADAADFADRLPVIMEEHLEHITKLAAKLSTPEGTDYMFERVMAQLNNAN